MRHRPTDGRQKPARPDHRRGPSTASRGPSGPARDKRPDGPSRDKRTDGPAREKRTNVSARDRRPDGPPRDKRPDGGQRERRPDGAAYGGRPTENPRQKATHAPRRDRPRDSHSQDHVWLYGRHAVVAALRNTERRISRVLATAESAPRLKAELGDDPRSLLASLEIVGREEVARRVPRDAVHQGVAALAAPLPETFLSDLIAGAGEQAVVLVLDQVTDPHNAGAMLRSAEAFGAIGIVTTDRHTPEATGALAKAASGSLERVPFVRVTNLARGLRELKEGGFWIAGLSERGTQLLSEANLSGRIAIVLGAEGEGLRHLTEEHCDLLVRLPMRGSMPSLNVSNAAAITLYELARNNTR